MIGGKRTLSYKLTAGNDGYGLSTISIGVFKTPLGPRTYTASGFDDCKCYRPNISNPEQQTGRASHYVSLSCVSVEL